MKKYGFGGESSDVIVVLALVAYCSLMGLVFGAMGASRECQADWLGCLPTWVEKYQTLIASGGIIFTVVIAKQQLDNGRRQHSATVRRSFKKEIDALQIAEVFLDNFAKTDYASACHDAAMIGRTGPYVKTLYIGEIEFLKQNLRPDIFALLQHINSRLDELVFQNNLLPQDVKPMEQYEHLRASAAHQLSIVLEESVQLKEYWS